MIKSARSFVRWQHAYQGPIDVYCSHRACYSRGIYTVCRTRGTIIVSGSQSGPLDSPLKCVACQTFQKSVWARTTALAMRVPNRLTMGTMTCIARFSVWCYFTEPRICHKLKYVYKLCLYLWRWWTSFAMRQSCCAYMGVGSRLFRGQLDHLRTCRMVNGNQSLEMFWLCNVGRWIVHCQSQDVIVHESDKQPPIVRSSN